ncbi:single-stranded DNA-binding protein [Mucilaginibacter sp. HD30]
MSNASGVNKIFLVGCVETTPKKHTNNGGNQRIHFVLSTSEAIKKGSQQIEHVEMHHVFIDGQHQDIHGLEIAKGATLHITGKIQTRTIIDAEGVKQYKTEIMIQQLTLLQVPVEA